tara:strand:+ start:429 stop:611 length:183 start_codon:yes stop_codon:yes gene_type:complete
MIIVNDIQDAITMKNKIASVLRRSVMFGSNVSDIQLELDMLVGDLIKNIDRIESQMEKEA